MSVFCIAARIARSLQLSSTLLPGQAVQYDVSGGAVRPAHQSTNHGPWTPLIQPGRAGRRFGWVLYAFSLSRVRPKEQSFQILTFTLFSKKVKKLLCLRPSHWVFLQLYCTMKAVAPVMIQTFWWHLSNTVDDCGPPPPPQHLFGQRQVERIENWRWRTFFV